MNYRAYGLILKSSSPIPPLPCISSDSCCHDVEIQIGEPSPWAAHALRLPLRALQTYREKAPDASGRFSLGARGTEFFELRYADGTRFLVDRPGSRVWGFAGSGLTYQDVLVYLLGPVMGFVLRRRGQVALHASSAALADRAIVLAGAAGSGKSTAAAALALLGVPILCEDISPLQECNGVTTIVPGYPRISLWPESVEALFGSAEALPAIVHGWAKRYLPLDGIMARFAEEPKPLGAIYFFADRSGLAPAPLIEDISQKDAALELVRNTYMNWLLDKAQREAEFDAVAALAASVPCFRLTPSADPARISALARLIERHAWGRISIRAANAAPIGPHV